jgi:dTDP-4-amino-4,6-dideoxygalactose transaminase
MSVPFFRPSIGENEIEASVAVMPSIRLTTGCKCKEFESEFLGAGVESVAVNPATAGLHFAGEAGPGDEFLTPTLTFTASAAAFYHLGAEPGVKT